MNTAWFVCVQVVDAKYTHDFIPMTASAIWAISALENLGLRKDPYYEGLYESYSLIHLN